MNWTVLKFIIFALVMAMVGEARRVGGRSSSSGARSSRSSVSSRSSSSSSSRSGSRSSSSSSSRSSGRSSSSSSSRYGSGSSNSGSSRYGSRLALSSYPSRSSQGYPSGTYNSGRYGSKRYDYEEFQDFNRPEFDRNSNLGGLGGKPSHPRDSGTKISNMGGSKKEKQRRSPKPTRTFSTDSTGKSIFGSKTSYKTRYTGNKGKSGSSTGFGQGLGGGLLLGFVAGGVAGHGLGTYRYGGGGGYDTSTGYGGYGGSNARGFRKHIKDYNETRPFSCYTASLTANITGDLDLVERLAGCNISHNVCYGKMTLTVTNSSSNGTLTTSGSIIVEKGCGTWADFNQSSSYSEFDSLRQCFTTELTTNNVTDRDGENEVVGVEGSQEEVWRVESSQEEVCVCEGSGCNLAPGGNISPGTLLVAVLVFLHIYRKNAMY